MDITAEKVDEILLEHNYDPATLVSILQKIQSEAGYLPVHARLRLTEGLGVAPSRIKSLATFYRSFSLEPTGRHHVGVCLGTACHIRGGTQVLERLENDLGVRAGQTTPDRRFTLETVRCLGCCALAPVVRVDDNVHGRLNQQKVVKTVSRYK